MTELIDLSEVAGQSGKFDCFLEQVRDRFGFDHVAYMGSNPVAGTMHGYVTYPDEWKKRYTHEAYHLIDPTLRIAQRSIAPIAWSRIEQNESFRLVFRAAREYGISDRGMTIPVRGPFGDTGMLSVTLDTDEEDWHARIAQANVAGQHLAPVLVKAQAENAVQQVVKAYNTAKHASHGGIVRGLGGGLCGGVA